MVGVGPREMDTAGADRFSFIRGVGSMRNNARSLTILAICGWYLAAPAPVHAQTTDTYFDTNGATAGIGGGGGTTGNWASGAGGAYWTTSATGTTATAATSWASSTDKNAVFDATGGLTAATVPLSSGNGVFVTGLIFRVDGYAISPAVSGAGFTLQRGHTVQVNTGTATISAVLLGTVGYNVTGGGTLLLSNTGNTITGAVNITGNSTLQLTSSATIGGTGVGAGDITLGDATTSGTLSNTATGVVTFLTTNRNILLGAGGGTVSTPGASSAILTYGGNISGSGNTLTKTGAGELRVSGTYTFGNLIINGGLYYLNGTGGADSNFGSTSNTVTIAAGAAAGTGLTATSSPSTRTWTLGTGGDAGFIIAIAGSTWTIGGPINGGGNLVLNPSGFANGGVSNSTLVLTNPGNTYSGTTTVRLGTLEFAKTGAMSTGAITVASGATLAVNAGGSGEWNNGTSGTASIGALIAGDNSAGTANRISWTAGSALGIDTTNAGGTLTYSGTIGSFRTGGNAVSLSKLGTGTLVLDVINTYTGGTTVTSGTLAIGDNGALGTGALTLNGGGISASGAARTITNNVTLNANSNVSGTLPLTLSGSFTNSGGNRVLSSTNTALTNIGGSVFLSEAAGTGRTLIVAGSASSAPFFEVSGNVADFNGVGAAGSIQVGNGSNATAATLTLSGTNTHTGATNVSTGSLLNIGSAGAMGTSTLTTTGNGSFDNTTGSTLVISNNIALSGGSLTFVGTNNLSFGNNTVAISGAATRTITTTAGTLTVGAVTQDIAGRNLTKAGGGTLVLLGSSSYTGNTTISGGTLQLDGSIASGSAVVQTAGTLSGSGTVSGNATLTGNGIINFGSTGNIVGTLGVTGGNWNGAGSVTGLTTSSSGTFNIGSGANLTADGDLSVTGGSITATDATSTITGNVSYTSGANSTFQGVIAGSGKSVTMNNAAATLTLSGANTYTGGTTISAGTLQVGNGGTVGSIVGDVTDNAALVFNRSDNVTYAGVISGSGMVTQLGTGILQLTTPHSYSGGTFVSAGTLQIAANDVLPTTGSLSFTGGTFDLNGVNQSINALTSSGAVGTITTNLASSTSTLTVGNGGNSGTFGGVIQNGAGIVNVVKTGIGTQTFTGANTYTGGTTISGGTLQVGNGGTSGSIAGDVTNNGSLVFNRSNDFPTFAGTISGSGSVTKLGAGALNLTAANTYGGGTTVFAGTLTVNNTTGSATGTGAVTVSGATAVLGGNGTIGAAVTVQNGGTLAPGDSTATLHVTGGDVTLASPSTFQVALGSANPTPGTNTNSLVAVTDGSISFVDGTVFDVRTAGQSFTPFLTYEYIIGTVSGANNSPDIKYNGSTLSSTITGTTGDGRFTTDYASPAQFSLSRSGGNLILDFTPVPEPEWVTAIFAVGLGGAVWLRRRRNQTPNLAV